MKFLTLFGAPRCLTLLMVSVLVLSTGCDSENSDESPGERELITRVDINLNRTDVAGTVTANAISANGLASGSSVVTTVLLLQVGASYTGTIELTGAAGEDITEEVFQERTEHQFFYTVLPTNLAQDISITTTDTDSNGLPVGLEFKIDVTGEALGTGSIRIVLGHYDETAKDGTTPAATADLEFEIPMKIN